MMNSDSVKEWSQRLRHARRQGRTEQAQSLLSAFAKIDDAVFKEQIVILLEIVASNPKLLARSKSMASSLMEPAANVIQFNPAR